MASYEPFGHLQHKLWLKEGVGVKLAVWLPTTKSRESTRPQSVPVECYTPLKRSEGGLQFWFKPCPDRSSGREVMNTQSPGSPSRDNFGTPKKMPFGCGCHGEVQGILYGGRWWLPPSLSHGESSECKVARGLSQHWKCPGCELTLLWLVLDAGPCNYVACPLS
jgi:hypothetical protein